MLITKEQFHFRSIINLEETLLNFSGLHPAKLPKLPSWGLLRPAIPSGMIVYLLLSCASAAYSYDFDLVVESIMLGLGVLRFVLKLLIFLHQRRYFFEILQAFEEEVFYSFTSADLEHIRAETNKTKVLRALHFLSVFTYIGFLGVNPFIFDTRVQLVPVWEPLDLGLFTFGCHLYAAVFTAYNHVSLDTIFTMATTFACCQFDVMRSSLQRVDFREEGSGGALRGLVIRHLRVLSFIKTINNLVSYMALVHYVISIFVICITLFQIMKTPHSVNNIAFLICMVVEVIRYCSFGEAIKHKNEQLSTALYLTNWEEADTKTRKMILMMAERCQKPTLLDVGGFTTMSLSSFVNIMRSAYSSFTVLRQAYN